MVNRIDATFARLRAEKRKGFIPYICAGDPDLSTTVELSLALGDAGSDILELGVPFSDPLADGIVNQLAAQRALAAGATVRGVLDCVRQIRNQSQIPIVLYTYLNPIIQFGFERFHNDALAAGVDGLLMLDLPPEEEVDSLGLPHIRLIAPTTMPERISRIANGARGFLYYVSREGVTGVQQTVATALEDRIKQIRNVSDLPIAVGFGISTPEQAKTVAQHADAVVVGSAIVDLIAKGGRESVVNVSRFAGAIAKAINNDE
ncbi:MAG TPA: tryptophan synthase subunit alpha [Chthoniobacterales bacterium]|nr:tryptophan synthase subunit alpha [Chthoniobacterales bacterium]